jgi:large subunit ribosomal protein L6
VTVTFGNEAVKIAGPRGELSQSVNNRLKVSQEDGHLVVERRANSKQDRAMHGLTRSLLANMVEGVTKGYTKRLELHSSQGDVYRVTKQGENLVFQLGFSHTVEIAPKPGVRFDLETPTRGGQAMITGIVLISGNSKEDVGQQSAEIRSLRPPEPYKGKGIRYTGEYVRRKAGKAGKAGGKGAKGKK